MAQGLLYSDAYNTLTYDAERRVLLLVRSNKHFPSRTEILRSIDGIEMALLGIKARGLMLDVRRGPLRSDPEFEEISRVHFLPILARYSRVAVLVSTATGRMQVRRIQRENGSVFEVFDDEAKAKTFFDT
jgi:hypothetical protein